jgi:putative ABC transport system permease protein
MRGILAWLTDAPLADSIIGDLEESRPRRGTVWFWSALAGVTGYAALMRVRELSGRGPFRGLGGHFRDAARVIPRRPGFAACTIVLLALGIGANTAVFSVVRAVLMRPLPYSDADRLVLVWGGTETRPGNRHGVMTGEYVAGIGESASLMESWAVVESWEGNPSAWADLIGPAGAERLRGMWVTPNFFETLRVPAAEGRTFSSVDRDMKVAVISDALWRRRFSADPSVVGKTVTIAVGRSKRAWYPFTIVGVMPPDFRFTYPRETEIYFPRPWSEIRATRALTYHVLGRLAMGVTPAQAQAQLTTVARRIVASYGWQPKDLEAALQRTGMLVESVEEHMRAEVRGGIWLLGAVAALVLLIACVNLGLLVLARTVDRRGELGLRAALGASRGRIITQLTAESALLSLVGGAVGVATAMAAMPVVRALMPPIVPRADQIAVDSAVLGFAVALMIVTTFICGIVPAWIVLRRDLIAAVRGSATASTPDRAILLSRRLIVTVQVAVVVLLLVGAGLLLRSFWRLQQVDLGFTAPNVVTMEMRLINPKYREPGSLAAFHDAVLDKVRQIPGVARAGMTTAVPMRGVDFMIVVGPKGQRAQGGYMRSVDPEYFRVLGVPLRAGRLFTAEDTKSSEPVTIVSESYGRLHFGNQSPIGRTLDWDNRDVRIVGVVGDMRYADPTRDPAPAFYRPRTQHPVELVCLVVEPFPGMRQSVVDGLRGAIQALDPEQPVEGITTVGDIVSGSTADRRFYAAATGSFAAVALLLAIAGVFGAVARTVTERRRELAIRVALGADPRRMLRLVYGYGLWPAAIGTAIGLGIALAGSRVLRKFLFEIAPTDAATYAGAAAMVFIVTAVACYVPARRTLRMPPMFVLKSD